MFKEKIEAVKNWVKAEGDSLEEYRAYSVYFPKFVRPSGILGKEGLPPRSDIVDAMVLASLFSRVSILEKVHKGKKLMEDEKRRVREEVDLNIVPGTYKTNLRQEGLNVTVNLDNPRALDYLRSNTDQMIAFLLFDKNKKSRYKAIGKVPTLEGEGITYNFPDVSSVPDNMWLNIYTRPLEDELIDHKFMRLSLILH